MHHQHAPVQSLRLKVFQLALIALLLAALLPQALWRSGAAQAAPQDIANLIVNGDFSAGQNPWWSNGVSLDVSSGALVGTITSTGSNPWDALFGQNALLIQGGAAYTLTFDIHASAPLSVIAKVQDETDPWTPYWERTINLTTSPQSLSYNFTPTNLSEGQSDASSGFQFQVGGASRNGIVITLDNVVLMGPNSVGPVVDNNPIKNGSFKDVLDPWWATASAAANLSTGCVRTNSAGANPWDAALAQKGVALTGGTEYTVSFDAFATSPVTFPVNIQFDGAPYTGYFGASVAATTSMQHYSYTFTASESNPAAIFQYQLGQLSPDVTVCLDNITLRETAGTTNILANGDFAAGFGTWSNNSYGLANVVRNLCVDINTAGSNLWDVILGQNGVPVVQGKSYRIEVTAMASAPITPGLRFQENGGDYTSYFSQDLPLVETLQTFAYTFTSAYSDTAATFQFQMGGMGTPAVCFDSVSLDLLPSGIRLNQVGYAPQSRKVATWLTPLTTPQYWALRNSQGTTVMAGMTTVFGQDAASGDYVHLINFSAYQTSGLGYTLKVLGDVSHPFNIGRGIYRKLKYDALAYFYHNRSGIAIEEQYVGSDYDRPAGHVQSALPQDPPSSQENKGDFDVTCFNGTDEEQTDWAGCDYRLDVQGGWYDAGDHGKYVVNGGISVWTLLNQYERAKFLGVPGAAAQFSDGSLSIPERNNNISDLLDEARWELEFLLRMQIPATVTDTDALIGMVHHKVHDAKWTGLPMPPHLDPQQRFLYPPSTAATLNLAATGAQCARIWRQIRPTFAQRCLNAARLAWNAAVAHPTEYARNNFTGGGPYDDTNLNDEFFWAASELFITTGAQTYRTAMGTYASAGQSLAISWQSVGGLGSISLAVVPNALPLAKRTYYRNLIKTTANSYLATIGGEGYGVPIESNEYGWGSNSEVLNRMLVMALAHNLTGQRAYLNGVVAGMDYLLGRNAMDQSYVSGYGENDLENPHHRFWAHQLDDTLPGPPPGAVSGGPNTGLQDPLASVRLAGCEPQKCFMDDINSWSTNEITINWNAPLAWVAAYLDEALRLR